MLQLPLHPVRQRHLTVFQHLPSRRHTLMAAGLGEAFQFPDVPGLPSGADKGPLSLLALEQSPAAQLAHGAAHCDDADAVLPSQLPLRRQALSLFQLAGAELPLQQLHQLHI